MTAAIRRRVSTGRSKSRTGRALRPARRSRPSAASCAASGLRPTSRRAALRRRASQAGLARAAACSRARPCACIPTGDITVLIGTHNHGQGHETTFAQIVSEKLGMPTDRIEIVFGDTDKVQFGLGTYGSRSLAVGGPALAKATDKVIAKGKKIAAHLLEASDVDIEFEAGTVPRLGNGPHQELRGDRGRGLHAGQLSAGDPRARPRGAGVLRSGEFHLSGRRAYRRSRD